MVHPVLTGLGVVRARLARHDRRALWALAGALLLFGGFAGRLALTTPAYLQADEPAHVGYVLALADGTLPSIDTPIPLEGEEALRVRVEGDVLTRPHRRDIYVANNPPVPYLVAVPLAEVASWAGASSPTQLTLRLLNVAGAIAAVACTYLLARELSGGDALIGVGAAGLVAATVGTGLTASVTGLDGGALAATTGLAWAVARAARCPGPGRFLLIGIWAAASASVRPMSAAFAAVAIGLGLVIAWRASGWQSLPGLAARLVGPALVLAAPFYALNQHRYGDPTGSAAIFEKIDRAPGVVPTPARLGSVFSLLWTSEFIDRDLFVDGAGSGLATATTLLVAISVVVAVATVVVTVSRSERRSAGRVSLVPMAWISMLVFLACPVALVVRHVSSGGNPHPRYLLPLVPILAAGAALLLRRAGRWALVAVLAAATLWLITRAGVIVDAQKSLARIVGQEPPPLLDPGSGIVRLALVVTVVGGALFLAALIALAARADPAVRERATSARPLGPDARSVPRLGASWDP